MLRIKIHNPKMGVRHFLSKDLRFKITLNYPGNVENKKERYPIPSAWEKVVQNNVTSLSTRQHRMRDLQRH